eukprot:scaffold5382_cov405-Prasinococcus_capsulatus_cf.AAC.4
MPRGIVWLKWRGRGGWHTSKHGNVYCDWQVLFDLDIGSAYRQLLDPNCTFLTSLDAARFLQFRGEEISFMQMQARVRETGAVMIGHINKETREHLTLNPGSKKEKYVDTERCTSYVVKLPEDSLRFCGYRRTWDAYAIILMGEVGFRPSVQ